ncbi:hypothetical protein [Spiroplasma endosymbiont of Danaus chrysippus]|uniref:hypothetical protein n=1 Tax=Spiroplasma endosymbiont of Danaus chrysippus TaxID=2691041 RepID=UPI00157B4D83|nr:hypothetical protein [Spiroplasma endosymbiont of Danaus chrysippus]
MSEPKKSSLFESIQKNIDSVDKGFTKQEKTSPKEQDTNKDIYSIELNKKVVKTISIDQKTQNMLNELKENNYKVNLSQLVRREVSKIYKELISKNK